MDRVLEAGVVGAGVFGGYHAAQYARLDGVTLAAVFDPAPGAAEAVAARHGANVSLDLGDLLARVDIVSITSPAVAHAPAVLAALRAGKAVYVEKPLATSLADADAIVAEAARRRQVVACGFLERAAFAALGLFGIDEPLLRLESARIGLPSPRNRDVSVVLDLMIHDLDLTLALARSEPLTVEAEGDADGDVATAEITFDSGLTAVLQASRAADARRRSMRLVYASGTVTIDFLSGAFENTTRHLLNRDFESTEAGRDRLGASLAAFIAAVRDPTRAPLADARDGARALDLALAVEQAIGG